MSYKNRKIIALIPARGGSKRITGKNIKPMAGKPLLYWAAKAAKGSKYIDEVWVSTEDPKIKGLVEHLGLGVKVLDRPVELAEDSSSTESVMIHFMEHVDFDVLTLIQATSPLTTGSDLNTAIELFFENKYDSLLTGVLQKKFFWTPDGKPLNYDYMHRPRRQDFEGVIHENGAFYLTRREILEKNRNRLGGKIGIYLFPTERGMDIDEPSDWEEAEKSMRNAQKNE